jgi:hypothetical protein
MSVLNFNTKEEIQPVNINGVEYNLPAVLDVEELATVFKLMSASKALEEDKEDPKAYSDLADALIMIKDLFRVYNSDRKIKKLRLSQENALEILNKVYQKNV